MTLAHVIYLLQELLILLLLAQLCLYVFAVLHDQSLPEEVQILPDLIFQFIGSKGASKASKNHIQECTYSTK